MAGINQAGIILVVVFGAIFVVFIVIVVIYGIILDRWKNVFQANLQTVANRKLGVNSKVDTSDIKPLDDSLWAATGSPPLNTTVRKSFTVEVYQSPDGVLIHLPILIQDGNLTAKQRGRKYGAKLVSSKSSSA
jgi:hypothetical protein